MGLPRMRGRVMVHQGQGPGLSDYRLGGYGGVETVTLVTSQIPSHTHTATLQAATGTANSGVADGRALAHETRSSGDIPDIYVDATPSISMMANSVVNGNTGGGQWHENRQPYQVVNVCIALLGVYPSRN